MKLVELKKKNLPDVPGVYFFLGAGKKILYIGRATSLRDRVKSYFKDDVIHTRGALIVDMVTQAIDIETIETDSVLEAVILEANLIKKYQPRYNTDEKDDKSFNYVIITREDFPKIELIRGKELFDHFSGRVNSGQTNPEGQKEKSKPMSKTVPKAKYVFGPYPQGTVLREGMKIIRRIFPYRDARCWPAGSPKNPRGKPCFNRQIGLCPGVCTGEISKHDYGRIVQNIKLFFEGRKGELITQLERQMKAHAKVREFEQANQVKKTIFALTHIQDISLIKEEMRSEVTEGGRFVKTAAMPKTAFRIEAYDIAHMGGQNTTGVMVVLENHHVKKTDYRMFKVRLRGPRGESIVNDVGALKEVLNRRLNHPEWQYPNIIAVDGAAAQKNAAEEVLRGRGFDIAVMAVVKNDKHRPDRILGDEKIAATYSKEILLLNSEAHRFAIKYHRKLRSRF